MGMFQIKVQVANTEDRAKSFEEMFWVDTGALYSYVPEDRLHELGVLPTGKREFVFADGRKDTRLIGNAVLKIEGIDERQICVVVFAPKDSLFLLGATSLENFGVDADPVAKRLKPIIAIVGGFLASR